MKIFLSILLLAHLPVYYGQQTNTVLSGSISLHKSVERNAGIIYFSSDNGTTWEDRSNGLPNDIFLSDIAVADGLLGISTKQSGIFLFDFQKNSWMNTLNKPQTSANLDVLFFHNNTLFVGTQNEGIFISRDKGKTWAAYNTGLGNLTIRRFAAIDHRLYAGTNAGLYVLDEQKNIWLLAYTAPLLQVNGITEFEGEIYIGTNQGAFKTSKESKEWKHVLLNRSLHNISVADKTIYASVYNELFASTDKGKTWTSDQKGMPFDRYTFQVIQTGPSILAAQWDGIYRKEKIINWMPTNQGLPAKFPAYRMKNYKNMVVVASSGWVKKKG